MPNDQVTDFEFREQDIFGRYVQDLDIRLADPEQPAGELSGGNQQKVVLAKWLATEPRVLIMDEPTRGIDVGSKSEVHGIMNDLARQGISIIMISSDMPEVLECYHITGEFDYILKVVAEDTDGYRRLSRRDRSFWSVPPAGS